MLELIYSYKYNHKFIQRSQRAQINIIMHFQIKWTNTINNEVCTGIHSNRSWYESQISGKVINNDDEGYNKLWKRINRNIII